MNDKRNTQIYTIDGLGYKVPFFYLPTERSEYSKYQWGREWWTRDVKGDVIMLNYGDTVNHYGVTIDLDVPTTGVYNMVDYAQFVSDCDQGGDSIDLDFEDWQADHECEDPDNCECEYYSDCAGTTLIGGWVKGEDGKYKPDKSSEFSAIVNETTIQVVWSIYIGRGGLCSPCYPGQVDADSEGVFKFYAMPPDAQY